MVDSSINNVEPHLPIDYKMKNNNNQVENNLPATTDILPPSYNADLGTCTSTSKSVTMQEKYGEV